MKETYGTPSECFEFIDNKNSSKSKIIDINKDDQDLEIERNSQEILAQLESSRNGYYDNDDDRFLYHCLYNNSFSITKYLVEVDSDDQIQQKRQLIIQKIKTICDVFAPYSYEDRCLYLDEMHLILRILKPEDIIEHVIPSFVVFIEENDQIKHKFLENCLLPIEHLLSNNFELAVDQIIINVIPQLENLLRIVKDDLQDACINTISHIIEKIKIIEAATPLNNMITSLLSEANNENCEVSALKLIARFAQRYMDSSHLEEFCEHSLAKLASSSNITAKINIPNALLSISKNISSPIFHKHIYPFFIRLCEDSCCDIKNSCAESIGEFSHQMIQRHNSSSDQISACIPIIKNYVKGDSRTVKHSIFKEFGKCIYQISLHDQAAFGPQVDNLIVEYLEERSRAAFDENYILNQHTAFNIPAIVLVSSPKLWKLISEHYFDLCASEDIDIRISLSSSFVARIIYPTPQQHSFHEVFKILQGCQLSSKFEKQMIEVFERYTKDIDDVKYKILDNTNLFLPIVHNKDLIFPLLMELYDVQESWRIQFLKGKLISSIVENFDIEKLIENNFMIRCEELLESDNYSVQKITAENYSSYLLKVIMTRSSEEKDKAIEYINQYKESSNYKDRMIFIYLTHRIINENSSLFESAFLQSYKELCVDKIANVKILIAKVLLNHKDSISSIEGLQECQNNLIASEIREIKALYNEQERKKQTTLDIKYDKIYLNFIDCPDPIILNYTGKNLDFSDSNILIDKSEDLLLSGNSPLLSPNSGGSFGHGEISDFNEFLDKI